MSMKVTSDLKPILDSMASGFCHFLLIVVLVRDLVDELTAVVAVQTSPSEWSLDPLDISSGNDDNISARGVSSTLFKGKILVSKIFGLTRRLKCVAKG